MKACFPIWRCVALLIFLAWSACAAMAGSFQFGSVIGSSLAPPTGGAGDSMMPIISADGRYVLFASTANNLMLNTNGNPIPTANAPRLNAYMRDRTNGTTTLVSVNLSGIAGGNGDSIPTAISTSGQFVLFESAASDLVTNSVGSFTNNVLVHHVFVRDVVNGMTTLVSVGANGVVAGSRLAIVDSRNSVMTPDGRYVAFVSSATNLVDGDTNGIPDVFVRDLQGGTTTLASVGAMNGYTNGFRIMSSSELPILTPDGRYVAFFSTATNLVPGVTNMAGEIYVRDLVGGTTVWVSTDAQSILQTVFGPTNTVSYNHVISDDGQFVAYEASPNSFSNASPGGIILRYNLQSGLTDTVNTNSPGVPTDTEASARTLDMTPDGRFIAFVGQTNGSSCIYLWDAQSGDTTLVSGDLSNSVPANSICDWPRMAPGGQFVAFICNTNLTSNSVLGDFQLYMRDTQAGVTTLVNADTNGIGWGVESVTFPRMSADGRFMAFEGPDGNLVPNDNNHDDDVFVRDITTNSVELISAHAPGLQTATPNGVSTLSSLSVSADGRYVAFASDADNLVANDTNGLRDVFVRDRQAGANVLVSADANNIAFGNGSSASPAISGDGRYVAFTSRANNLVANDDNNSQDVFLRDLQTGTTKLVSVSVDGIHPGGTNIPPVPNGSFSPSISTDGRYVLFYSYAKNLTWDVITGSNANLFVRDMQIGTNYALTTAVVSNAVMTPDGHYVAFVGDSGQYVWNSQSGTRTYTNSASGASGVLNATISPDGTRLAYSIDTANGIEIHAVDMIAQTNWLLNLPQSGERSTALRFSGDGKSLAYVVTPFLPLSKSQVYLYDFQARTNILVSKHFNQSFMANSNSYSPDISADGRFIAYRSTATDIVSTKTNGVPDILIYDRLTDSNTVVSVSRFGAMSPDNRSRSPVFSGDGRTLFFECWASDIATNDFNHNSDVISLQLYSTAWILSSALSGQPLKIIWTMTPGRTYRVQYKDNLTDPAWQDLNGTTTQVSDGQFVTDLAPNPHQRFYRILSN